MNGNKFIDLQPTLFIYLMAIGIFIANEVYKLL